MIRCAVKLYSIKEVPIYKFLFLGCKVGRFNITAKGELCTFLSI